jgi:hypothetical protein
MTGRRCTEQKIKQDWAEEEQNRGAEKQYKEEI